MDDKMLDDLIAQLDAGMMSGTGHINVDFDENLEGSKNVETMGCTECSKATFACSVPTLHDGLDDPAS